MVVSSSNSKYKAAGGACKKMNGGSSQKKPMVGGSSQKKPMVGGASKKSKKSKKTPMKANEGYCVQCRKRVVMRDMKDVSKKTSKRTMKMRVGKCPSNHTVYKIVGGG
jgi:hypothetical protein